MQIELKLLIAAFTTTFAILPIQIADDKGGDLEILLSAEDAAMQFKRRLYKNPKLIEIAKKILPKFDSKGILDEM